LSENAHLPFDMLTALSEAEGLRYPHPSSLRRTSMYASFHGISLPSLRSAQTPPLRGGSPVSEALHLSVFHQPLKIRFFDSYAMCPEGWYTVLDVKIFSTLFMAVFATTTGAGLVAPLLPIYARELGAGALQIGMIFGAFSLSRSIFVPYFGKMSDVKGKKPFLSLGLFIYFVLSILYVFSNQIRTLILLRLGQGVASAMILPVAQAYVGMLTPKNREGFTMGLFNISLYGGLSVGPVLGGLVRDWFGMRISFLSMGILALFGFLLCFSLLPAEKVKGTSATRKTPSGYLQLMKDPAILALFAFRICFTTGVALVWAFLPLMASARLHLSSSAIGVVVMMNVLVNGLFQIPMGLVADTFSKGLLIITGGLLGAVSIYYLNMASTLEGLLFANGLLGVAGGVSLPAIMALGVIDGRRTGAMGSVMGLLAMSHSLGMLAGPLLGGLLLEFLSFDAIFAIFGPLALIAGTLLFTIAPRRPADAMEGAV
jgi:DHA1 family multidrug resistance protein-like MFS transporter